MPNEDRPALRADGRDGNRPRLNRSRRAHLLVLVGIASALVVGATASAARIDAAVRWTMHDVGVLPGDRISWPVDLNDRGAVAVNSNRSGEPSACHAFVRQGRTTTRLGTLGGRSTCAVAINERGEVVGSSSTSGGREHAFLWRAGRLRDLGTLPGGKASDAVALNERGQVVGTSSTRSGARHAFLWQRGRMVDLGTLDGRNSYAVDINEAGWIVGTADVERPSDTGASACGDPDPGPFWHAFLWRDGKMIDLGTLPGLPRSRASAITDSGLVVGEADWSSGGVRHRSSGFVWHDGRIRALSSRPDEACPSGLQPLDANERGEIVGSYDEPVLWKDGRPITVGTYGFLGYASAINERGQVVGTQFSPPDGSDRAFVWENGRLGRLGGVNAEALAINDHGMIAGRSGSHAVVWTTVP